MTYTPSGNPGTRADGLSATVRTEFTAIGTAFAALPAITTTGAFSTIFAQLGNFSFTLPGASGALALVADVSAEAARAMAAEALLAPRASPAFTGTASAAQGFAVGGGGQTWTSGLGVPSSTQPTGSLYSRGGGTVGATLYVSQGGGVWNAVAGV